MGGPDDRLKFVAGVAFGMLAGAAVWEWYNTRGGKELFTRDSKPATQPAPKPEPAPTPETATAAMDDETKPTEGVHDGTRPLARADSDDE